MAQADEPTDASGSIDVPPELQQAINEAVTADLVAERSDDPATLDTAVSAWEAASRNAAFPAATPAFRAALFDALGHALRSRYERQGTAADLGPIIAAFRQALDICEADDPNRARFQTNLATGLSDLYAKSGTPADLDAAIDAWQRAAEVMSTDDPDRAATLGNLGNRLSDRYARTKALADLDGAIDSWKRALDAVPADAESRPTFLATLGAALREHFDRSGEDADLDAVITTYRETVDASRADDPDRPMRLTVLGNALEDRYARTGDPTDLEAALTAYREALETSALDSRDRPGFLSNVGRGLIDRYAQTGSSADLEAAIAAWGQAVDTSPAGAPNRPMYLSNLAGGLRERFDRTGDQADLDGSIAAGQEAVAATPAGSRHRPAMLSTLGISLADRFEQTGAPADLEAAIDAGQSALGATPADSPDRPIYLSALGDALRTRYDRTEAPEDLEAAITAHRQALDSTLPDAPDRAWYLNDLGRSLRVRYRRTGARADLDAALVAFREALDATTADTPRRSGFLAMLGSGLRDRHALSGETADLEAAVDAFRRACEMGLTIAPSTALTTAQSWGAWASEREAWTEATEAYGIGLTAIEQLYQTQLLPGAKEAWLADAQGLAAAAAYAMARVGDTTGAFLALERGRAHLLTEAIQRDRADLADVKSQDPATYAAYEQAAGQLRGLERQERSGGAAGSAGSPRLTPQSVQGQARQARADLEAATDRIRQLPGRATFGQPPSFDGATGASEPGMPIVALVSTAAGSLALVVARADRAATAAVEAIWAPAITLSVLQGFMMTVEDGQIVGGYLAAQRDDPDLLDAVLADGLPRLGADFIGLVAARLREMGASGVVLLPTGPLGLLPLHAASYRVGRDERCLIDEFDVSYTPGARVLSASRAAAAARDTERVVFVGVGNPQPHPQPLAFARVELEEVERYFPESANHTLYETAATETALIALLSEATHVHLACHGQFDVEAPLDSSLELAQTDAAVAGGDEGRLRLAEILANDWFDHCRLVVLSACQTAVTDARRLPDEAIGLPAGMLQAGVPGVIGTLWSVEDLSTTLLMAQFYAYHRQGDPSTNDGPMPPAAALRRAQGWLRTRTIADLMALLDARQAEVAADRPDQRVGLARADASTALRQLGSEDPTSRPFAAPSYWAPFVAIGA